MGAEESKQERNDAELWNMNGIQYIDGVIQYT